MKILGISCYYHDAAAAIIIDGEIVVAAEEERFSRVKHDSDFPHKSISFCLQFAGVTVNDLDYVVFYEKPFLKFERILLTSLSQVPKGRGLFVNSFNTWINNKLWIKSHIAKNLNIDLQKILFCQHHLSHAASAFYTSKYKESALLTIDGVGEWTTTAWGVGSGNKIELKGELKFPHSLGLFYSAFTEYLGFEVNEGEFKVMGLAPYGKPKYKKVIEKLIKQKSDGSFTLDLKYFNFHRSDKTTYSREFIKLLGVEPLDKNKSDSVQDVYADIAASAQKVLEEKVLNIAKHVKKQTKENNLCLAGGVALNGVVNWKIFKEAGFKNIFIHPAAGDSGGALGAALYLYHHVLNNKRKVRCFEDIYLGQKNDAENISEFIKLNSIKAKKLNDKELINTVVKLISKGKVIGWVRGRFEWGPRALGARSILADPRSKKMKDIVNTKIKFREAFRPFAPVTLYEEGHKIFEVDKKTIPTFLEYMIGVVPVRLEWRSRLGAVTHVDGTARPQFIKREKNPVYYDLIKLFGEKTGVPVLLNTSFNLKGEPIVNTCGDAYKTFMKSGLDVLVLENYLIVKG